MKRRAVLTMLGLIAAVPPWRAWAEERQRAWRAPRVERGWVLAEDDR